jgi:IclR family transcriptional regulator, acetate operon repressor
MTAVRSPQRGTTTGRAHRPITNPVARTVTVLERLASAPQGLSVTEIALAMRVNKAIAFRVLVGLQEKGYVQQDPLSLRYRLTLQLAALAFALIDSLGLEEICQPFLDQLAAETKELAQLAVVDGNDMIFVARAQGDQAVKVTPLLGRRVALHASAGGKVWLSSLPEQEATRLALAQGLTRFTARTLTTVDQLRQEWARVRRHGYATVIQEYWDDVSSVGAPVRVGRNLQVVAAVSVAGPTVRFGQDRLRALAPRLIEVADAIGRVWPRPAGSAVAELVGHRHG